MSGSPAGGTTAIRVISGNQTVRLATQPTVTGAGTVLRTPNTIQTVQGSQQTATAQIGGKQVIIQKPMTFNNQQFVTLVKTSKGMTVQTVPQTVNVVQKPGVSGVQTSHIGTQFVQTQGATVVNAAANTNKTAVVSGNVVKLMPSTTGLGTKQIVMKNSNILQVGKVQGGGLTGKPTIVITNKAGQQIRTNQHVIVVTTTPQLRTVQSGSIVTTSANNFVNVQTSQVLHGGTSSIVQSNQGTVKMIRSNTGKPITLIGGIQAGKMTQVQNIMPQKTLTIGGKALTVQLSSATGPKTVTILPAGQGGQLGNQQQKKIIVVPSKAAFLQQQGGHQIKTVQVSNASGSLVQQAQQVQDGDQIITVAGNIDPNSIDINDMIEQTDGLVDISTDDDDSDVEEERFPKKRAAVVRRNSLAGRHGIRKAKRRVRPRYIKLGLFGGNPTEGDGETNTAESSEINPEAGTSDTAASESIEAIENQLRLDEANQSANNQSLTDTLNETTASENETTQVTDESSINLQLSTADGSVSNLTADTSMTELKEEIKEEEKYDPVGQPSTDIGDIESNISSVTLYKPKDEDGDVKMKNEQADEQKQEVKQESSFTATPSETETEAANILTTIKSGELIANQQQCFELLSEFESTTATGISTGVSDVNFIQKPELDSASVQPKQELDTAGTVIKTQNGDEVNFLATDDDMFKNFTSGPLDALASAALQASTNQQLQTTTTTVKKAEISSPLITPKIETKKPLKVTPKEEVNFNL